MATGKKRGRPSKADLEKRAAEAAKAEAAASKVEQELEGSVKQTVLEAAQSDLARVKAEQAQLEASLAEQRRLAAEAHNAKEAAKSAPETKVVLRNAYEERRQAALKQAAKLAEQAKDMGQLTTIGIWTNPAAIRALRLDKWLAENGVAELVIDEVPYPGCTTNKVNFKPGTKQALPQHVWDDIYSRCDNRMRMEEKFSNGGGYVELVGNTLSGKASSGGGRRR